jgi:hypothetical protein
VSVVKPSTSKPDAAIDTLNWRFHDGNVAVVNTRVGSAIVNPTSTGDAWLWRTAAPGQGRTEAGVEPTMAAAQAAVADLFHQRSTPRKAASQ